MFVLTSMYQESILQYMVLVLLRQLILIEHLAAVQQSMYLITMFRLGWRDLLIVDTSDTSNPSGFEAYVQIYMFLNTEKTATKVDVVFVTCCCMDNLNWYYL